MWALCRRTANSVSVSGTLSAKLREPKVVRIPLVGVRSLSEYGTPHKAIEPRSAFSFLRPHLFAGCQFA